MAPGHLSDVDELTVHLSTLTNFLYAIGRLRTLLLQSSPSLLASEPEELITLIEVAKNTLTKSGVSLHTFSSCPGHLRPYKAAYFGLLIQLQAHNHNAKLCSRELQVRLNRLLFPLTTRIKRNGDALDSTATSEWLHGLSRTGNSWQDESRQTPRFPPQSLPPSSSRLPTQGSSASVPSNTMMPPPLPFRRGTQFRLSFSEEDGDGESSEFPPPQHNLVRHKSTRTLSENTTRRHASHDTLHFKHRNPEPEFSGGSYATSYSKPCVTDESVNSATMDVDEDDDDSSGSDDEAPSTKIVIPARSPLRRSFGIFCTGKGMGAFSGSGSDYRNRHEREHRQFSSSSSRSPIHA